MKFTLKPQSTGLCQWESPRQCCCLLLVGWRHPAVHLAHGYYVQHPDRSWSCHFSFTEGVRSLGEAENELFVLLSCNFRGEKVGFCAGAEQVHENKLPFHLRTWLNNLYLSQTNSEKVTRLLSSRGWVRAEVENTWASCFVWISNPHLDELKGWSEYNWFPQPQGPFRFDCNTTVKKCWFPHSF